MSRDGRTRSVEPKPLSFTLRSHKIRIEVVRGPDAGMSEDLPGPEIRVGGRTGDLVLSDPTVSHEHVLLRIEDGAIWVTDMKSRNGTLLDGLRIHEACARPDSQLTLGNTTLRLRMSPDEVELPLYPEDHFWRLLGASIPMRRVYALLAKVALSKISVLIEGESGTGKELAAEAIHKESARRGGPFVVFDCSAVPSTLIESELFGHVRGSFTGAVADRRGRFEEADGGTLFLDELGELPLDLQPKLLRALETSETRRLGDARIRRFDVRIVAATNRFLPREVERGRFREDLYYRIASLTIRLPPLRERPDDIPMLVRHFENLLGPQVAREGMLPRALTDEEVEALAARTWPGNVRELRNAVERALSVGAPRPTQEDEASLVLPPVHLPVKIFPMLKTYTDALARKVISAALERTGGNKSQAAALLGTHRQTLQEKMKDLGM